jgi:hypothetical protein
METREGLSNTGFLHQKCSKTEKTISKYDTGWSIMVVVSDALGEMITGGFAVAIVADGNELAAARLLCWRFFFAAFFEIVVVSMVTKKGKSCV